LIQSDFHHVSVLRPGSSSGLKGTWTRAGIEPPPPQKRRTTDLDEDLLAELVGRRQPVGRHVHGLGEQHVPEHLPEGGGHVPLLHDAAVVLDGQDDGEAAGFIHTANEQVHPHDQ